MSGDAITRAVLQGSDGNALPCQFNPTTVRLSKHSTWTAHPARGAPNAPPPQFVGTGPEVLTAKLLFDGFDTLGGKSTTVQQAIAQLLKWTCVPPEDYGKKTPQPPTVTFSWGTDIMFKGFLSQVSAEYTMFSPAGSPLRATADISIQQVPDDPKATNPSSGGIAGRRSALLGDSDSLATVAYAEYGDPALWRAIAAANGIEDPARVPVGTRLLVPPRTQAERLISDGGEPDARR
jgi:Contractile injection system tube protein